MRYLLLLLIVCCNICKAQKYDSLVSNTIYSDDTTLVQLTKFYKNGFGTKYLVVNGSFLKIPYSKFSYPSTHFYSSIEMTIEPDTVVPFVEMTHYYFMGGRKGNRFTDSAVAFEFERWLKARKKKKEAIARKSVKHKNVRVDQGDNSNYTGKVNKKQEEWLEVGDQQSGGINTISNVRGTSLITEESVLIAPTRNGGRLKIKMNLTDSSLIITGDTTGIVNTLYDFIVKQNTH